MWPLSLHRTVSHQTICVTEKSPTSFISSAQKLFATYLGLTFLGGFCFKGLSRSALIVQAGGAEEQNPYSSFDADYQGTPCGP